MASKHVAALHVRSEAVDGLRGCVPILNTGGRSF